MINIFFYENFTTFVVVVCNICGTINFNFRNAVRFSSALFKSFSLQSFVLKMKSTDTSTITLHCFVEIRMKCGREKKREQFECDAIEIKVKWAAWCRTIKLIVGFMVFAWNLLFTLCQTQ